MKKSALRKKAEDILDNIALLERKYNENKNERFLSHESVTKIEKELETIKNYIENYIALIRKLPNEEPPTLPDPSDTLSTVEAEKKAKKIKRIINAQQQYKLLELGLSEFEHDFNQLKEQVELVSTPSSRLLDVAQLKNELALQQSTYLQLYENLQKNIELPPFSVSSIIATDPELQANLNLLKHHCNDYAIIVKKGEAMINEARTEEEQLVSYQYGIEQLKEYSNQYEQYRQKVHDRIHVLELIENDYKKAITNKNLSIAFAKKILTSSELQHSLELTNDSNHSFVELIGEIEKYVNEIDEQKHIDVEGIASLNEVTQRCLHDKVALDFSVEKLSEQIVKIQQDHKQFESEQIVALQNEFSDIYKDIKSKLDEAFLDFDGIDLIKSQFDTTIAESNTTKQNQLAFSTNKIKRLKDIISQLNKERLQQENRIKNKLIFDTKFIQKGMASQQNQIIEQIKTSHFRLSSLEQEVLNAVLRYQVEIEDGEGVSLEQLKKQYKKIKEQYIMFTKEYGMVQGIIAIHTAVKNLFRQDKTLTTDTFIDATNSTTYGGQLLIVLAQYVNKEQLIRVIEKNLDRFNEQGMVVVNEYYNLINVSST